MRERTHVLILVQNLPVPFDRRVWAEATTLREAGYLVTVICPASRGCHELVEEIDGVHIRRYRPMVEARRTAMLAVEYAVALSSMMILALKVNRRTRVSVIHLCNPPDLLFLVALPLKLLFGARVVFDHHDLGPELVRAKGFGSGSLMERLALLLERATFASAGVIISTNESYREIAVRRGRKSPAAVFVVRSGPRLNSLGIVPGQPRLRRGARFLVGYVGVMGVQEGLDHLLDAAKRIVAERGPAFAQFALLGDGPELARLKKAVQRQGLGDVVTFYGRVSDECLVEALSTADVCVNPDTVNELNDLSTMNKVVEYMALGKPIVQFDLKEGRASAAEASLYAEGTDGGALAVCILRALDDPVLRERLGTAARRRFETALAWEHQVPALLAAYTAILSGSKARRLSEVSFPQ